MTKFVLPDMLKDLLNEEKQVVGLAFNETNNFNDIIMACQTLNHNHGHILEVNLQSSVSQFRTELVKINFKGE